MKTKQLFRLFSMTIVYSLICIQGKCQQVSFEKIYGQGDNDIVDVVKELPGGGFLLSGTYNEPNFSGDSLFGILIVKTNSQGDTIFTRRFPLVKGNPLGNVVYTDIQSNSYCIGSLALSFTNNTANFIRDYIDSSGNNLKTNILNLYDYIEKGSYNGRFTQIFQISHNQIIIFGETNTDTFVMKSIDSSGKLIWQKRIFDTIPISISAMNVLNESIFISGEGKTKSGITGISNLSFSKNGNLLHSSFLTDSVYHLTLDAYSSTHSGINGRILLSCTRYIKKSDDNDAAILEIDSNLNFVSDKLFALPQDSFKSQRINSGTVSIDVNKSGEIMDYWFSNGGSITDTTIHPYTLTKLDNQMNVEWSRHPKDAFGFTRYNQAIFTSDGGYAIAGSTLHGSGSYFYLAKLNSYGELNGISPLQEKLSPLRFYPNPSTNLITMQGDLSYDYIVEILNIQGQSMNVVRKTNSDNTIFFDRSKYPSGVYLLKVTFSSGDIYSGKLILK